MSYIVKIAVPYPRIHVCAGVFIWASLIETLQFMCKMIIQFYYSLKK